MKKIFITMSFICVLFLISGCINIKPAPEVIEASDELGESDWLSLEILRSESAVLITATGCEEFNGITDRAKGIDFNGGIITDMTSCVVYGTFFSSSYSVETLGAKSARYTMRPEQKQTRETITLGINYYSVFLSASFFDAESVEIEYGKEIKINGLSGDFLLQVSVFNESDDWFIGAGTTKIAGRLEQSGDLILINNGDSYSIASTEAIRELIVEGSDGWVNGVTFPIIKTDVEKKNYVLLFGNDQYILK